MTKIIPLPVEIDDGVVESVTVTLLGNGNYRVEDQPVFCESITVYDVISGELDASGCLRRVQIVEKTGWKSYHFLLAKENFNLEQWKGIVRSIESQGGRWNRVMGGIVIVSVPPRSSYDPTTDINELGRADSDSSQ